MTLSCGSNTARLLLVFGGGGGVFRCPNGMVVVVVVGYLPRLERKY